MFTITSSFILHDPAREFSSEQTFLDWFSDRLKKENFSVLKREANNISFEEINMLPSRNYRHTWPQTNLEVVFINGGLGLNVKINLLFSIRIIFLFILSLAFIVIGSMAIVNGQLTGGLLLILTAIPVFLINLLINKTIIQKKMYPLFKRLLDFRMLEPVK